MSLVQRIETLRKRHAEIDTMLWDEEHRPLPDIVKLHHFKREKLFLKDRIFAMSRDDNVPEQKRRHAS
jgi:hypothetical protein